MLWKSSFGYIVVNLTLWGFQWGLYLSNSFLALNFCCKVILKLCIWSKFHQCFVNFDPPNGGVTDNKAYAENFKTLVRQEEMGGVFLNYFVFTIKIKLYRKYLMTWWFSKWIWKCEREIRDTICIMKKINLYGVSLIFLHFLLEKQKVL